MEIYSTSKALYHVDKLAEIQRGNPISPTLIQIDLEAWCNDNCSFCSYRKDDGYNKGMLELLKCGSHCENKPIGKPSPDSRLPESVAKELPLQMKQNNIPAIELTGGGEPTMWPYFDILLDNLIQNEIEIGLVTNGSNLPDSRLKKLAGYSGTKWVRFSMDASNQEIHKLIHRTSGEDFARRVNTIKKMVEWKHKDLVLGISFIITPDNWLNIESAIQFYKNIGVNNIRFSWMYDKSGNSGLDPQTIDVIKAKLEFHKEKYDTENFRVLFERGRIETYDKPNDDFSRCYYQQFVWNIGADSLVYPCCIQKYNKAFALGDIRTQTITDIILSSHTKMTTLDPMMCNPCWLRNRNKDIAKGVEKPQHHNFV